MIINISHFFKYHYLMKLLQLSSCLFSTVSLHAYYIRIDFYHHIFLLITMLSILNHEENRNYYIHLLDFIIAHYAYIQINISDSVTVISKNPIMIFSPIITMFLFYLESFYPFYANEIHFILHLYMVGNLHLYLYYI